MNTVDLFELYVGRIFALLYARFPLPKQISVEDIKSGNDAAGISEVDQSNVAGHTWRWLQDSGYISPTVPDQADYFRGTLTAKGFECLRALPRVLTAGRPETASMETLGDKLVAAAEDGAADVTREAVKEVLRWGIQLVAGATKAAFST